MDAALSTVALLVHVFPVPSSLEQHALLFEQQSEAEALQAALSLQQDDSVVGLSSQQSDDLAVDLLSQQADLVLSLSSQQETFFETVEVSQALSSECE